MSGDWYFEMQVYRRKYNRMVRKYNAAVKKLRFWKGLSEGGSGDINYTKWRRSFMWSAAWKASAKKYRKAYSSHLSPADDYFKREEYFIRAEAAEKRVAELEFALRKARLELGVPQENYPAPIVEAWMIIDAALNKDQEA